MFAKKNWAPPGMKVENSTYVSSPDIESLDPSQMEKWAREKAKGILSGINKKIFFPEYHLTTIVRIGSFFTCGGQHFIIRHVEITPSERGKGHFKRWLETEIRPLTKKLRIPCMFEVVTVPHVRKYLKKNGFVEQEKSFIEECYAEYVCDGRLVKCSCTD